MRKLEIALGFVIGFILILIASNIASSLEQPQVGKTMPSFKLTTIDGKELDSGNYVGKKPLIINFWASW